MYKNRFRAAEYIVRYPIHCGNNGSINKSIKLIYAEVFR